MIDQLTITHHIQKHIVSVLMHQKFARFRDMRPSNCDTNLYSYHLKALQRSDFVVKTDEGYSLGTKGLLYVDRVSTKSMKVRTQPKIVTMLVIQDGDGNVLLYKRKRQPFTDLWTLPYGKLHIDDKTITEAAKREASEKLGLLNTNPRHAGDCYIRVADHSGVIMSTLVHVFRLETDDVKPSDTLAWARPHKLGQYELAPAVEHIVTRAFFNDPYFFEEYSAELLP